MNDFDAARAGQTWQPVGPRPAQPQPGAAGQPSKIPTQPTATPVQDAHQIRPGLQAVPPAAQGGLGAGLAQISFGSIQANALIDKIASGKLSRAEEAKNLMAFANAIKGMPDRDLLGVARKLTEALSATEGSDEVLGEMLQSVFDKMDEPELLSNQLRQSEPMGLANTLITSLQKPRPEAVQNARKLADEIMHIGSKGGDPATLAQKVFDFQSALNGMNEKELLAVARYLGENMAEGPDKVDRIVEPMMKEVLNRLGQGAKQHQLWDQFPVKMANR
ncbi:MAG: hypothetical protein ACAI44_36595 [Candidatus Sericytochromatia bacterium]